MPQSAELYQLYILQAIDLGYSSYAEYALQELSQLMENPDFEAFRQKYEAVVEKRNEDWETQTTNENK